MNAVLDILISLGINKTVFIQFGIFIISFLFLKIFIFSPYLKAYEERRRRTVGVVGAAKELQEDLNRREAEFSEHAKILNEKIKSIFEEKRLAAQKESNALMAKAQTAAQVRLNEGKKETEDSFAKAREQLKNFVPDLGQTIKQRLMDR